MPATASASADKAAFYHPIDAIPPVMMKTLVEYSRIPPLEVLEHVQRVRDQAFDAYPYPCLGLGAFLRPGLQSLPEYPKILHRLKSKDQSFLDVGCGLGQELRLLAADGVPTRQLHGLDLQPEFVRCGNELFRDGGTFDERMVVASILAEAGEEKDKLDALRESMDVVFAKSFLHVFSKEEMFQAVRRLVGFLSPKPGSLVVGSQIGVPPPAQGALVKTMDKVIWFHCVNSLKEMWREVGAELGVEWKRLDVEETEMSERTLQAGNWPVENIRVINFVIERA